MTFTIHRGTNISHWLSQSRVRGAARQSYFQQSDVQLLAGIGLDHLRIPIDEEQMWDTAGNPEADAFVLLNNALDWCAEAGLKAIVDLHILRSHYFLDDNPPLYTDPAEAERFANLWRSLSDHLKDRPVEMVAYELLNEAVANDPADWNRVARVAFDAVREREPERTIVLGSNHFCFTETFDQLDVPDDDHLILTFHFYEPMLVTHYRALWCPGLWPSYTGPIHYPGDQVRVERLDHLDAELLEDLKRENMPFDRGVIRAKYQKPLAVRERTGCPLYCGEFGAYHAAPQPLREAWFRDMVAVFDEYNIAWANWDYKGNFGLYTHDLQPDQGVIDILFPAAKT